ncbi:MAG: triple tyrosine motif-containing protein [Chitinophagaceae bacterium]
MVKSLFTILLIFTRVIAFPQIPSSQLTVDDGLPLNSVWTITQDKNGLIWFGTLDGLCSYDGFNITTYKNIPGDSSSISENCRHDVYIDIENNLWVAHTSGISKFYQRTSRFDNIYTYAAKQNRDVINRIVGESKNGNVWAWIYGEGIVEFTNRGKIVNKYSLPDIKNEKCVTAKFDNEGNIYVALESSGIFKLDLKTKQINHFLSPQLGGFCITPENNLIISGQSQSLLYVNEKGETLHEFIIVPDILSAPDKLVFVNCIIPFRENIYYIGTTDGIFILNLSNLTIKRFQFSKKPSENYAIGDCLFKDLSGNLWAGTTASGVRNFLMSSKKFELLQPFNEDFTIVKAINKSENNLFVGYFEGGIDVYTDNNVFVKHIDSKNSNLPSDRVNSIMAISENKILVGFVLSYDIGILDWRTNRYESVIANLTEIKSDFYSNENFTNSFSKLNNSTILFIRNAFIYRGTFSKNKTKIEQIDSIPNAVTTYIFSDKQNKLWVGSYNAAYLKKSEKWYKLDLPVDLNVKCIAQHPNSDIWICGDKGLFVLDNQGNLKNTFNTTNGLPNEYVYGILFEADGNCWMSHNKGISQFNYSKLTFRHYTKSDGVQSNEFNTGAFYRDLDGYFYLGGINGVNYFNPKAIKDNPVLPFTLINKILVNDELYKSDTSYAYLKTLHLNYDQNTISIEFAGIEYTNQLLNQYKYRLVGIDKNWVDAHNQRFVRYPNLAPGNYVFEVISSNNDNVWNMVPTQLYININPPFWKTLWFKSLIVIIFITLFILSVFQINQFNTRKQRRLAEIQQKLQNERERISRDLHDNVGAQLSFINSNIDWIINPVKVNSEEEEHQRLNEINKTAQHVISNLRETIWALNKENIEVEDLSDKLKAFFQKHMQFNPEISLVFKEEIMVNYTFTPSVALHIFRIGQEIASNCLKYAHATKVDVIITTTLNNEFSLSISDNGKGFDPLMVDNQTHYGIENMKARAKEIGGLITIQSGIEQGTQITLTTSTNKIHQM